MDLKRLKSISPALGAGFALITLGLAGSLYFLFLHGWKEPGAAGDKLNFEIFKLCITTMLVGGVALLFDYYRSREDRRKAEQAALEQSRKAELERQEEIRTHQRARLEAFLEDFIHTYNEIKRIRRNCQRSILKQNGVLYIDRDRYVELMEQLNDSQLELEKFARILMSKPPYLEAIAAKGKKQLTLGEKYLREVTHEFEDNKLKADADASRLLVDRDSRLFEFAVARPSFEKGDGKAHQLLIPITDFFDALNAEIKREQSPE